MATERIRYVDTGSAGGDGTTPALSGEQAAYASLFACEAAENVDLVTADVWLHVYCRSSGGTADTTSVLWNNGNDAYSDATRFVLIEAAEGHRATAEGWKTDRYRLSVSNALAFSCADPYIRFDGLQMEVPAGDGYGDDVLYIYSVPATNNDVRVSNCRLRIAAGATFVGAAMTANDTDLNLTVWNTIAEVHPDNAGTARGFYANCAAANFYNCLAYGLNRGFATGNTNTNVYDSVAFECTTDFYGTYGTVDYCASDDNTGTNNVAESGGGAGWPSDFVAAATGNYTLLSSSNLVGAASMAGSGIFSTDIDGTTRGAAWDVGPHEYVAAGPSETNILYMLFES